MKSVKVQLEKEQKADVPPDFWKGNAVSQVMAFSQAGDWGLRWFYTDDR